MEMLSAFSRLYVFIFFAVICLSSPSYAGYKDNYVGDMETYTAIYEDTLVHLARKHGLGFIELRAANPTLDPWIPGAGAEIILPKRHLLPDAKREGLVINLPEMRVYGFLNRNDAPVTYALGIGREGLDTPMGETSIIRKKVGPTWRPTQRMLDEDPKLDRVVPPGPDNPLGTHALYLGWATYAIHGTIRPYGIGRRVSSGCIRMYPESIIKLFEQVSVGMKVNVVNQPIKVAWIGNELYMEAHPEMNQAMKMEEFGTVEHKKLSDEIIVLITDKAGTHSELLNWPKIRKAAKDRNGYPVRIAKYFDGDEPSDIDVASGVAVEVTVKAEDKTAKNNSSNNAESASEIESVKDDI